MARRKQSGRVRYEMNVAFKEGQNNLPEVLTRLTEKVNRKQDAVELERVVDLSIYRNSEQFNEIQDQITELQDDSSVMPTDQITATGVTSYVVGFDMTSDSEANYDVSINGLVQDPLSDYQVSLAGNTLTFTNAPSAGADIVITQRDTSTFDAEQALEDFLAALQ